MKIGIDIRNIGKQRTGDETVFFNLVKNLARIDSKNEYELFTDITDPDVLKTITLRLGIQNKINFNIVSLKNKNKFTWNLYTLPNYLRKHPLDIYHTQYITPFFVSGKIKIITHIHDVSFHVFPEFIQPSDLFFLKILIPLSLARADKIIAVSNFTKDELVKKYGINSEKIEVVLNALSDDFQNVARLSASEKKQLSKKYGLPDKYILYVGTLQPRKNIPELLNAYALNKDKLGGIKIVLCGNKNAHNIDPRIDQTISELGLEDEVIFPGFVDQADLSKVYGMAHVFAFPSLYEGFGIPILEAMSQEVPVISSDIACSKEIGGESVLFYRVGDLDDFSKRLYDISMDEERRNGLKRLGLGRVGLFSWKESAGCLLKIYSKL